MTSDFSLAKLIFFPYKFNKRYHGLAKEQLSVHFLFRFHGRVNILEDDEGLSSHEDIPFGDDLGKVNF